MIYSFPFLVTFLTPCELDAAPSGNSNPLGFSLGYGSGNSIFDLSSAAPNSSASARRPEAELYHNSLSGASLGDPSVSQGSSVLRSVGIAPIAEGVQQQALSQPIKLSLSLVPTNNAGLFDQERPILAPFESSALERQVVPNPASRRGSQDRRFSFGDGRKHQSGGFFSINGFELGESLNSLDPQASLRISEGSGALGNNSILVPDRQTSDRLSPHSDSGSNSFTSVFEGLSPEVSIGRQDSSPPDRQYGFSLRDSQGRQHEESASLSGSREVAEMGAQEESSTLRGAHPRSPQHTGGMFLIVIFFIKL